MSDKKQSFRRKESKFVVLEYTLPEIQEVLQKHIPIDTYDETSPYTMIRTIYLDDDKKTIFQEYLARRKFRFKIRFRNYGHNGIFDADDFWAEFKVKHHSISFKERMKFPMSKLEDFIAGENIFPLIESLNPGFPNLKEIYLLMRDLIGINELKPSLVTSYERAAFQNKSGSIRITVDRDITHKAYYRKAKPRHLNAIVLESKIVRKKPKWYKKLEKRLSLLPQKRFSKYATGINTIYYPARGIYNFYTNYLESEQVPEKMKRSLELIKEKIIDKK